MNFYEIKLCQGHNQVTPEFELKKVSIFSDFIFLFKIQSGSCQDEFHRLETVRTLIQDFKIYFLNYLKAIVFSLAENSCLADNMSFLEHQLRCHPGDPGPQLVKSSFRSSLLQRLSYNCKICIQCR